MRKFVLRNLLYKISLTSCARIPESSLPEIAPSMKQVLEISPKFGSQYELLKYMNYIIFASCVQLRSIAPYPKSGDQFERCS